MNVTIQLACDPNASIQTILTSATNGMMGGGGGGDPAAAILSSPENCNLYFSALIANQPPLTKYLKSPSSIGLPPVLE